MSSAHNALRRLLAPMVSGAVANAQMLVPILFVGMARTLRLSIDIVLGVRMTLAIKDLELKKLLLLQDSRLF